MFSIFRKIPVCLSRRDFQYQEMSARDLSAVMWRHIYTGMLGNVFVNMTTGMYYVALGNGIGVSIVQWSILQALSAFAISFQLVSAFLVMRFGYRRIIWFFSETSNRLLRGIGYAWAYYLFFHGRDAAAAVVFVVFLSLASFPAAAAQPPWLSWMGDIIPEPVHGRFIGRRDAWVSFGAIAALIPVTYYVDLVQGDAKVQVLMVMTMCSILLGMLDVFLHRQIPEPECPREPDGHFAQMVLEPFRDREYVPWLVFSTAWYFAMTLGFALSYVFFINDLDIRRNYVGGAIVLVALPLVGTMCTSRYSGWLIDRLGVRRALMIAHGLWGIQPLFWIVATPATALFWLAISSLAGGAAQSACVNAANKFAIRVPPPRRRAMYIAVTSCLNNIAVGLATLVAGWFLEVFKGGRWSVGNRTFVAFHIVFLASFILRFGAWLLIPWLRTPSFDRGK